ncbi:hypothetical protein WR25_04689 [Diploscapter pachys]|uniref:Acyl-CoA dehydrogenase/oxidase N-terminal domain-containing protein n=1 Tax=Diploscapter pachys TaxID=2018661 RepID=A0A2A2J657_9BILA|nr:hypothetical protein WR25_04689 [Diploscapter pachys]
MIKGIIICQARRITRRGRPWIDRSVNPNVDEWEATGEFPGRKLFKELGEIGALGTTKPIDYDGLGLDYSYAIAVAEQIGNIKCGSIPMAICVQTDMATPALATYGSDYLKKEFLTPSVSGDRISCIAVSESSGGSDVAAIKTTASRSHLAGSTDLVVKGEKCWITNGIQADWACLLANTSAEPSHRNKSLICVPLNLPGIHRVPLAKSGMLCSDTAQIFFDDVKVPKCHIIGEEGDGFIYQMKQFQDERLVTVAVALSPLQRCIDETIEYTRNRRIFGSTILGQQYIQYNLAEMQTELEAVRSLLYRAVETRLSGEDVTMLASMGKLIIGKLARKITDSCMQVRFFYKKIHLKCKFVCHSRLLKIYFRFFKFILLLS